MLVNRLTPRPFLLIPDHLIKPDGTPTYCPKTMSQVFRDFYKKLYNCLSSDLTPQFSQNKFNDLMSLLDLPKLTNAQNSTLNAPATIEEIAEVIKALPAHKSPGPDGLLYVYYKTFSKILNPHLQSLYSSLLKGFIPHSQFLHAYITVIPKPGKDPSLPDNYHPIAMLNSDYNIFTKILAN